MPESTIPVSADTARELAAALAAAAAGEGEVDEMQNVVDAAIATLAAAAPRETATRDRAALVPSIEAALFAPLTEQRLSTLDDRLRPLVRTFLDEWAATGQGEGGELAARVQRVRAWINDYRTLTADMRRNVCAVLDEVRGRLATPDPADVLRDVLADIDTDHAQARTDGEVQRAVGLGDARVRVRMALDAVRRQDKTSNETES